MTPDSTYSVVELAKLDSSICAVLAGFAFAVVILLVGSNVLARDGRTGAGKGGPAAQQAVSCFVAAFFVSIIASYQYAINGAEKLDDHLAFLLMVPDSFNFALASLLIVFGIVLLLASHRLNEAFRIARVIFVWLLLLVSLAISWNASDAMAVIHQKSSYGYLAGPGKYLLIVAVLLPLIAAILRFGAKVVLAASGFLWFLVAAVSLCSLAVVASSLLQGLDTNLTFPYWPILLGMIAWGLLTFFLVLFFPVRVLPVAETTAAAEDLEPASESG